MAGERGRQSGGRRPATALRPGHLSGLGGPGGSGGSGGAARPAGYRAANAYTRVIVDEALRRGISVEITDPGRGGLLLRYDGRAVRTYESLSELTSAVAFRICDDKWVTREVLKAAGLPVPAGRMATWDDGDLAFLAEHGELVVKPARGEGGDGVTVGVTTPEELQAAREAAQQCSTDVLLERFCAGEDLRVVVIGGEVVAASVRRPATVVGDGASTIGELIRARSEARQRETDGASRIPLDETTRWVVEKAGRRLDDVLEAEVELPVRRTANLHTGGTIHDVTGRLHPALAAGAVAVARAIDIPVVGVDLAIEALDRPGFVVIEANEQPGLANHEPQPTAQRFIDLLFPETVDGLR